MRKKLREALDKTLKIIDEKYEEFKDVKGMEPFVQFLLESKAEIVLRHHFHQLDADWLGAVCSDIKWKERHYKAEAGLLSPEEAAARKAFFDFMNSPCDLPPEVDIKPNLERIQQKKRTSGKFLRIFRSKKD